MFISKKAFFKLGSVQLENVFVGHSPQFVGLPLQNCCDGGPFSTVLPVEQAVLPGLKRVI